MAFLLLVSIFLLCDTSNAQEFKFTASCGKSLSYTTDTNCDSLNKKFDSLLTESNTTCCLQSQKPPPSYIPGSCQDIKTHWPYSPSGYYTISISNGDTKVVYCHMETLCNSTGPWTRIAYLDMSDPTQHCPSGFRLYTSGVVRACGRPSTANLGGCQSQMYISPPSKGYKEVCGKVIGYQYFSTDAFLQTGQTIDSHYVDGISLTYGSSPRKHIWTFAAGQYDNKATKYDCPCSTGKPQSVPHFVGDDYFCESGNSESVYSKKLYTSDPLWDGKWCGSHEKDCCKATGLPWFHKVFQSSTKDFLEMRICGGEGITDEDITVGLYEIYVK